MKRIASSIIMIMSALLIIIFTIDGCGMSNTHKKFTENMWKNEPTKRSEIISDLLETHSLIGMNKDEVISLLGNPMDEALLLGEPRVEHSYRCIVDTNIGQSEPQEKFDLSKENFMFYSLDEVVIPDYKRSLFIRLNENDVAIGVYFVHLET